ncbi:unnamed protein product [Candidula unifasciata]|uniref:BZIP domain-containing protein n=1 Tax=Candidula unifasciata TaxID=100452 RepID=A0A8S3ZJT9_9EUPU|nr:unnamed protein product [Candidula unifasciata]
MAEDGIETVYKTLPETINNSPNGGIVSNLLRKSSGYREGMYLGSGLEQKIQELRAEKEAGEMTKCPTSMHNDQDSPIDFSVKRRSSFSGSLTDDSQASLCSPGNATDYSVMSPAVDSESANHSGDMSKRKSGIFSGMSSEDIVNLYNRQLHIFKDKQSSLQEGRISPSSFVSVSNRNNNNHQETRSSSHAYPSTPISTSPPLMMPDHKVHNAPTTNFSIPVTAGSVNATIVSSTSSFSHSNSRKRPRSLPDDQKDAAYWERRRKNNDAAKRSRDARRAKEDEIAIRAALLEQENIKLRVEVAALKTETARLRCLLYNN